MHFVPKMGKYIRRFSTMSKTITDFNKFVTNQHIGNPGIEYSLRHNHLFLTWPLHTLHLPINQNFILHRAAESENILTMLF